jgi:predicted CoA-binding protein
MTGKKFFVLLCYFKNYILHSKLLIMEQDPSSDEQIREILSLNKITVVGMSKNSSKAAHYVPKYLSENGYDITPVNPTTDEILGKKCYSSISEIDEDIDIVDVFRPSDQVLPIIEEAIKKKPKVIWLQQGIHNSEAEDLAKEAGIKVIFNRCMLAEHQRLSQ